MAEYDQGDVIRCTGTFTDADSVATDPAAVFFQVKDPYRNLTEYEYGVDAELVRSAAGIYYADVTWTTKAGRWFYHFYSTGSGQASGESYFDIKESEF